ncbi:MAG: hypothetical protein HYZ75_16340 [Elusimicrobia bacterium]|nr:hypothetical protein [Elusimicrobiota bacterium]
MTQLHFSRRSRLPGRYVYNGEIQHTAAIQPATANGVSSVRVGAPRLSGSFSDGGRADASSWSLRCRLMTPTTMLCEYVAEARYNDYAARLRSLIGYQRVAE